jgi:glycosyltransferase involved in cell wall biosynthesis
MIKFGIIMPTYNRPDNLRRAISSVVENDYDSWMLSVVDDGSKTAKENKAIVDLFNDNRITYTLLSSNRGVNSARNHALDLLLSSGCEYIVLLDDDDVFMKDALSMANNIIEKNPNQKWYVFNAIDFHGDKITKVDIYKPRCYIEDLVKNDTIGDATHFMHRDLIKDIRFSTVVRQGKEWIFYIKLQSDMYLYDRVATKKEYLVSGLTYEEQEVLKEQSSFRKKVKKQMIKLFFLPLLKVIPLYGIANVLVVIYEFLYQKKRGKI